MKEILLAFWQYTIVRAAAAILVLVLVLRLMTGGESAPDEFRPIHNQEKSRLDEAGKLADKTMTVTGKVVDGVGCIVDAIENLFK